MIGTQETFEALGYFFVYFSEISGSYGDIWIFLKKLKIYKFAKFIKKCAQNLEICLSRFLKL